MILMYQEKFVDAVMKDGEYFEVFSNPSPKEMDEVSERYAGSTAIRFLADDHTKTLYVFNPNFLHESAQSFLGLPRDDERYLRGTASKEHGKWLMYAMGGTFRINKNMLAKDWSWVDKWIPNVSEDVEERRGSIRR